jgi:hypothetical protein
MINNLIAFAALLAIAWVIIGYLNWLSVIHAEVFNINTARLAGDRFLERSLVSYHRRVAFFYVLVLLVLLPLGPLANILAAAWDSR